MMVAAGYVHSPSPTTFSATGRVASAGSGASTSPDSPPTSTIRGTADRFSMVATARTARLAPRMRRARPARRGRELLDRWPSRASAVLPRSTVSPSYRRRFVTRHRVRQRPAVPLFGGSRLDGRAEVRRVPLLGLMTRPERDGGQVLIHELEFEVALDGRDVARAGCSRAGRSTSPSQSCRFLVIVRARVYNAPPSANAHERTVRVGANIKADEEHANVGVSGVRSGRSSWRSTRSWASSSSVLTAARSSRCWRWIPPKLGEAPETEEDWGQ